MARCTTHQLQDTERPSPPPILPPRRLMVVKLLSVCAVVRAWPVVMSDALGVATTQEGRSIDKARGEARQKPGSRKEAFYLADCTVMSTRKDLLK